MVEITTRTVEILALVVVHEFVQMFTILVWDPLKFVKDCAWVSYVYRVGLCFSLAAARCWEQQKVGAASTQNGQDEAGKDYVFH